MKTGSPEQREESTVNAQTAAHGSTPAADPGAACILKFAGGGRAAGAVPHPAPTVFHSAWPK